MQLPGFESDGHLRTGPSAKNPRSKQARISIDEGVSKRAYVHNTLCKSLHVSTIGRRWDDSGPDDDEIASCRLDHDWTC